MAQKRAALVEDFDSLKAEIQRRGLFQRSRLSLWSEVVLISILFGLGCWFHASSPLLALLSASIGGITLVWWIHDSGHDANFASRAHSKLMIESLGILFLGMPQIEYHYEIHRRHHGATNVIGRDGALETGPIIWHEQMQTPKRQGLGQFQPLVWFFFILPLTWPLITFRCVQTLIKRKYYGRLAALILRWALCLFALHFDLSFLFIPILVTGFVLGFSASLNHFHMPMDQKAFAPFPLQVFYTTMNLSHRGRFATWLTGGLNFHIEHHLFPTLPSQNLAEISPLVHAFARRHNLPYQVCTAAEATRRLTRTLQNPLAQTPPPALVRLGGNQ